MSAPWPTLQATPIIDVPPWNWNPVATFQTAYNNAQEEKRAQETFEIGMQLEQILLPAKIAKAEYDTKKFAYDSKLLEKIYRTQSAALDNSYRGVTSAIGSTGSGSMVQGSQPSRYGGAVAGMVQSYLSGGGRQAAGGARKLGQGHTGE
jgi:hypothetical protein